jgi:peptidase E
MKRSDFFKKVLDFSGSYDDFVDFLLDLNKNLVVKKVERLAYIPYGSNEERFQNFYLLDFEE